MDHISELNDAEIAATQGGGTVDDAIDWLDKILRDYLGN